MNNSKIIEKHIDQSYWTIIPFVAIGSHALLLIVRTIAAIVNLDGKYQW